MKKIYSTLILIIVVASLNSIKAQEVKINDNFVIEADGTPRLDNAARVWDDLRVTIDKGSYAASFDYFSGSSGPQIWFFRGTSNAGVDAMSFTVQLPHTWKEGTNIHPHIHWTPKTTDTNSSHTMQWNLDYTWANYDSATPEVFPAINTTSAIASGPFTAQTHRITNLTANDAGIDGTGKKISSVLICRIWRDATSSGDTYSGDAGALFIDFHIEIDTQGSREEFSK